MYKIKFTVGDRWNDGHGRYEAYIVNCSHDANYIIQGIVDSEKLTGFNLVEDVCRDYEDSSIPDDIFHKLENLEISHGIEYNDYCESYGIADNDAYIKLILNWIGLSIPDFKYNIIEDDVPEISLGGYGLFYG